jgi:hypothetical protein
VILFNCDLKWNSLGEDDTKPRKKGTRHDGSMFPALSASVFAVYIYSYVCQKVWLYYYYYYYYYQLCLWRVRHITVRTDKPVALH